jgi:Putative Actinobacterial Holin-X, holin superfamily III
MASDFIGWTFAGRNAAASPQGFWHAICSRLFAKGKHYEELDHPMSAKQRTEELNLPMLLGEIARDTGTLVTQQVQLLRAEVGQEVRKAGVGVAEIAAGGGLAAAGGLLTGMMLAHLLQRVTRLPLWICYGVVGGSISAASFALLKDGQAKIADLHLLPPPESAAALQENVEWIKDQLSPNGKPT